MKLTRDELSWSLYDVGNSAFSMLLTAIMPIYFKGVGEAAGFTSVQTTSHWGYLQSGSTLIVALLAPVLGSLADYKGYKKKLFVAFMLTGVLACMGLAWVDQYTMIILLNVISLVGYSGSINFYDGFLVDVTSDERMDYVSSFGFAIGYIGSCVPFIASIFLILKLPFGLDGTGAVRLSFLINAIWWVLFSLPMFTLKQRYGIDPNGENIIYRSFVSMRSTLKSLMSDKTIGMFLIAYFFYIDGVDTVIRMSTSFGADVGIDDSQMILALLATQVFAFPAVMICARIAEKYTTQVVIKASIVGYIGICCFAYFLEYAWQFWLMALCVAVVQGTIQALSRSLFGKLIPKDKSNEYFGFYNILAKYAAILGPFLMASVTALTGSTRKGVLSVVLLFVLGYYFFNKVSLEVKSA